MANIREMLIGWGKCKQADIATANTLSGLWRLNKLNASLNSPKLNTEDDAPELGKGHEFATTVYKTSWDFGEQIEKYLSAEFAAWVMAFSLGHVVKTGTTPNWIYTCTPLDPTTEGRELSYFSYLQQVRPGAGVILDRIMSGCAIEGWTLTLSKGPGRAASKMTVDIVGSGKYVSPSTITLPAATVEKLLASASLACTINGTDYVTAKTIESLTISWKNNINLEDGFYPGSGFQTGGTATSGAIRGRMEVGDRVLSLDFVARLEHASDEETKLLAQTENTAVLSLSYDTNNSLALTFQRIQYAAVQPADQSGTIVVQVNTRPLWHTTNHLITAVAKCNVDGIAQAES